MGYSVDGAGDVDSGDESPNEFGMHNSSGGPLTRSQAARRRVHYSSSPDRKPPHYTSKRTYERTTSEEGGDFEELPYERVAKKKSSSYLLTDSEDDNRDFIRDFDNYEVKDITIEFFYKPHTLTLLAVSLALLFCYSWFSDDSQDVNNLYRGFVALGAFFILGLSVLVFPNGPFVRPHPAIWRIVFGASMFYLCALVFAVNLSKSQIQSIINHFDSSIDFDKKDDKMYAKDCWDFRWANIAHRIDIFVLAHFLGYVSKAVMMRSSALCWTISIMWELSEMLFMHVLPNFEECLWDQLILDVVLCNGFGIFIGMRLCNLLEMREYDWESIKYINSASGKVKRALLQFTPMSWHRVQWFDPPPSSTKSRRHHRALAAANRSHGSKAKNGGPQNGGLLDESFTSEDATAASNGGTGESYSRSLSRLASDPRYVYNRIMLVFCVLLLCQVNELNCFCLKHIFRIPTEHVFNWIRLILLGLCVCTTARQYYTYTTDTRCKRLGTQAWVFIAINAVELFAVARFGWDEIFAVVQPMAIVSWLLLQVLAAVCCVYSMILYNKYFHVTISKTKSKLSKLRRTTSQQANPNNKTTTTT